MGLVNGRNETGATPHLLPSQLRIARQGIVAVHALRHHAQCGTTLVAEAIEARKGIALTLRWAVPGVV
jgi:hypothetical protein